MKAFVLAAALVATAFSTAAVAETKSGDALRVCAGMDAISPMQGSAIEAGRPTFRWTGEPIGTAKRDIILVTLSAGTSETLAAEKPYRLHGDKRINTGSFTWLAVFYDAEGQALCRSPLVAFSVAAALPDHNTGGVMPSLGPAFIANPSQVVVVIVNDRVVVVLHSSPYTGPRDLDWPTNTFYAGSFWPIPPGKIGLEIHGSDNADFITGSGGSDLILGYGGNDAIDGKGGDDTIYAGAGDDYVEDLGGPDTDTIYGGPGIDSVNVQDGDSNDTVHLTAGDSVYSDGDALMLDDTSP